MFKLDTYTQGSYLFPSDDINPKKKREGDTSKEFCLAFCKAFYSGWGQGIFPYSRYTERDKLLQLRKYSRGNQDTDIYYDLCYGRNDQDEIIRKGWMNVNWDIMMMALEFKDTFISKLNEIEFDPSITAQDQYSRNERQTKMRLDYVKNYMKPIFEQAGGDPNNIAPESIAEFEILEQMGVYKNQAEYAWEKFILTVFNGFNKWDLKLKNKLLDDIYTLGRLCVRDYVDPVTQTIKVQYVDPLNWIGRLTPDGEVIDGGFIDIMTVQELRQLTDISEEDLYSVAKSFCGYYGNPDTWSYGAYNVYGEATTRSSLGNCEWYAFRVPVLKCEYRSVDTDYWTVKNKGKEEAVFRGKYGKVYENSATKKTEVKKTINIYRGSWIIGTDHIFDYGLQYDQSRPEKAEARCSFHYCQMDDPSIVERCRVVFDQVQLAWLKYQNAVAKSHPEGYMYDMSLLKAAAIGGKIDPYDIIKGINQTGSGVFATSGKRGERLMSNTSLPIHRLEGGYEQAQASFFNSINGMSQLLYSLSGMNPSFTGSNIGLPEGQKLNADQSAASQTKLKTKEDIYYFVRSSCALNILLRGQVIFRHNSEVKESYRKILGDNICNILQTASSEDWAEYGMSMTLRHTGAIKMDIRSKAEFALQGGKNGVPGLTFIEYFKILEMLDSNVSIKYIQAFMQRLIDKREMQAEQMAQARIQTQNDGLAAIEAQKEISQLKIIAAKSQADIETLVLGEAAKAYFEMGKIPVQAGANAMDLIVQNYVQQFMASQQAMGTPTPEMQGNMTPQNQQPQPQA